MFPFPDDKPHGNHSRTVSKVLKSIRDGVESETLLGRSQAIHAGWKQLDVARRCGARSSDRHSLPQSSGVDGLRAPSHMLQPGRVLAGIKG